MNDTFEKLVSKKDKMKYLLYEFIGMALITVGYNFSTNSVFIYEFYFLANLISWELSCAHFNIGTTLTCLVYEIEYLDSQKLLKAFLVILM